MRVRSARVTTTVLVLSATPRDHDCVGLVCHPAVFRNRMIENRLDNFSRTDQMFPRIEFREDKRGGTVRALMQSIEV